MNDEGIDGKGNVFLDPSIVEYVRWLRENEEKEENEDEAIATVQAFLLSTATTPVVDASNEPSFRSTEGRVPGEISACRKEIGEGPTPDKGPKAEQFCGRTSCQSHMGPPPPLLRAGTPVLLTKKFRRVSSNNNQQPSNTSDHTLHG
ncbi:hypothetical protein TWF694_003282 [Orbilia ellipsospora]|uniref:Uncharacterized protein n=1 Tax=Orbilia ellipsospora TaxID=2528407 RepID=A0AAV9X148_9PEZI